MGAVLDQALLTPLLVGRVSGLSYALWPYCRPLSESRWRGCPERLLLGPKLFAWLHQATAATFTPAPAGQFDAEAIAALEAAEGQTALSGRVRAAAAGALDRLRTGRWVPGRALAHGDLWKGNILIRPRGSADTPFRPWWDRFVIIDWGGARLDGFPMLDLVRLARSLGATRSRLRAEVRAHCAVLNCDLIDVRSYLLVALGDLGLHLEHFPMDRYARTADACLDILEQVNL